MGIIPPTKSSRKHRVCFMLSDEEYQMIERHLSKYNINNKANWYRTTLISHVLKVMEEDYPTLFNEYEMRR